MRARNDYRRSDLFLVRIWAEQADDATGKLEWYGKVQSVVDGEAHNFDDWTTFIELLTMMSAKRRVNTQLPSGGQANEQD